MAEDKFTIDVNLNTKDATAKAKELNKEIKNVGETIEKKRKFNIDNSVVDTLDKIKASVNSIDSGLGNVGKGLSSIASVGKITAVVGALTAVGFAMKKLYDYTSDAANEVVNLSNKASGLMMNTNHLKAWETSFKAIGLSAQEADKALGSIQNKIITQMFNPSPDTAALFSRMGIQMHDSKGRPKNPETLMRESMHSLRQFDPYTAQYYGQQLGFSPEFIAQIRSNKNIDSILSQQKSKNVVTQQNEKDARNFVAKEADLSSSVDKLRYSALLPLADTIANNVIPELNNFAGYLNSMAGLMQQKGIQPSGITVPNSISNYSSIGAGKSALGVISTQGKDFLTKISNKVLSTTTKMRVDDIMNQMGLSQDKQAMFRNIISKESGYLNKESDVKSEYGKNKGKSVAYGIAQFQPSTIKGLLGQDADPMDVSQSIKALDAEYAEFAKYAQKNKMPINAQTFFTYHHLGQRNMEVARKGQAMGSMQTLNDVYQATQPIASKQNAGIINATLPNLQPTSVDSSVVSNITTNNTTTNSTATTNIANLNVHSNDPKGFANSLLSFNSKTDMTNSMTGWLA